MTKEEGVSLALKAYADNKHTFELFRRAVVDYFTLLPELNSGPFPVIHSIKSRMKDEAHLAGKIERKWEEGIIDNTNLFDRITDLAGVRILHIYPQQFESIHRALVNKVQCGDWCYGENPKAYTWDPEAQEFFAKLGITCEVKESLYTSIHYLLKPRRDSNIVCEVQIRTLFEEIWGEIDHYINYPCRTNSVACGEQLKVLGKLTTTGTRLADAIFNSLREYQKYSDKIALLSQREVATEKEKECFSGSTLDNA